MDRVASETAPYFHGQWASLSDHAIVGEARSLGLMGALEIVPFASLSSARKFAAPHAAEVMRIDQIPAEAVLGALEISLPREARP